MYGQNRDLISPVAMCRAVLLGACELLKHLALCQYVADRQHARATVHNVHPHICISVTRSYIYLWVILKYRVCTVCKVFNSLNM